MDRTRLQQTIFASLLAVAPSSACDQSQGVDEATGTSGSDAAATSGAHPHTTARSDAGASITDADATSAADPSATSGDGSVGASGPSGSAGETHASTSDGGDTTGGSETTGGSGGPLTDRLFESFTAEGQTSNYHVFADGLDWSASVGLLVYTDGSGGYGFDNPNGSYLLDADGSEGLVAVAREHNLLLLVPEAPPPGCNGSDNCWYDGSNAPAKARWSSALIDDVKSLYDLDTGRIVIGGYSSGAQWTTRYFLPAHGEEHSVDLAVAIAFGGAPAVSPQYSDAYTANTVVCFDTGTDDEAYTGQSWGAIGGYDWYTEAGFQTDATWPQGVGHGRGGEFAGIMDREITKYLAPAYP